MLNENNSNSNANNFMISPTKNDFESNHGDLIILQNKA